MKPVAAIIFIVAMNCFSASLSEEIKRGAGR
jgi:hypothetical protein